MTEKPHTKTKQKKQQENRQIPKIKYWAFSKGALMIFPSEFKYTEEKNME